MAFSGSRGILYTAPPSETDRAETPSASETTTEASSPAPADD